MNVILLTRNEMESCTFLERMSHITNMASDFFEFEIH